MKNTIVIDTNTILYSLEFVKALLNEFDCTIHVPYNIIYNLERYKTKKGILGYKARCAVNFLFDTILYYDIRVSLNFL